MEKKVEKRRSKRYDIDLVLYISNLFKQDNICIKDLDSPIYVHNISKHGIGFTSKAILPIGYYFNAKIRLGNDDSMLYTVVKIIRSSSKGDEIYYGCEFIGLAPILDFIFEENEESNEELRIKNE